MDVFKDHTTEKDGKIFFEFDKIMPKHYFLAVCYACKMLYKYRNMPVDFAVSKASDCYGVDPGILQSYLPEYVKQLL